MLSTDSSVYWGVGNIFSEDKEIRPHILCFFNFIFTKDSIVLTSMLIDGCENPSLIGFPFLYNNKIQPFQRSNSMLY